ncbi:MAG: FxLYD domain-containing protein [Candidatus Scalinduaceae bacterium]
MMKLITIGILILVLFGANSSSDASMLEDLRNFEKSLTEWVANFNKLEQRFSALEKNHEATDKQLTNVNESLSNIEILLTNLNAKVEKVEKMGSVSGVSDILKTYEGTLNVFKKRFSKMAKRLEDQEVKTAVLEKIYATAQKPLETMIVAMDEQREVINNLANRLDEQEKMLLAIEEGFKKQAATPLESLAKDIEGLNTRIANLESGTIVQRKEEIIDKEPKAEIKEKVAVSEAPKEEISETKGFTDIGKGFFIKNVEFKPFGSSSLISGEIMNKSDRSYGMIDFKVQAYNEENVILGGHGFTIRSFRKDSTETFEEIIVGVEPKKIAKYTVFFAEMPLTPAMGEEGIKIIERKFEVAMAETTVKQPQIEEEKSVEKKTSRELEGFENVGGGFYVRRVFFTSFGSSSTVTGEIKNNSENDSRIASFVMKVYSKDYGMITNLDFSVRRLKSGDIKPFEEIITGVRPFDIARYEIAFKESY